MTLPIADSPLWNKSIWTALDSRVASNEVGLPPEVRGRLSRVRKGRLTFGLCPPYGLGLQSCRREPERGAQPTLIKLRSGAAKPRLTSGGKAESSPAQGRWGHGM